jgi:GLPGLI family protein
LIDVLVTKKPDFVNLRNELARALYVKNASYTYKDEDGKYVPQEEFSEKKFRYTGKTKIILGYTCHEALLECVKEQGAVVWICKDLPATLTPGVYLAGAPGAVLEYSDKLSSQVLTEIKPGANASHLHNALQKIQR